MPNRSEDVKDIHDDDQKCKVAEASGSMDCSSTSLDNFDQDNLGRVRSFMLDGWTAASPPKFVSLEEIMKAAKGMQNMALAHEIAVDKNFKIDKLEPEDDTLHKKVKEIVHKAFWDILTNELSQDPPVYTQALRLLKEIKESLDELLLPHNARTKETVNQVLDIELIRQQAENGVLNFSHYSEYVISLMAKICAPVRDEKIEELRKCTDVIETFKGIMEVIQLMKLDLANFTISMIRPNIIASSIEYEKNKFAEFLKIQTDGLQYTRRWLLKHLSSETENIASLDINSIKQVTHTLLAEAYLDLLEFDFCPNAETLMLDQGRLLDLRNKTCRLAITGSILLLLKPLPYQLNEECKTEIKKHTSVLLESVTSNKDLVTVMPNICIQIKSDIDKIKQDSTNTANNSEDNFLPILESQILELSNPEHKIRQLVTSRIRQFLKNIILSQSAAPQQIPPGLSALQRELTDIAAQFAILIAHNRIVFGEYYQDIITTAISERKVRSFMLDGWTAASPPKFVSLEEIMKAAKGMQNMALAHEIAVDKNFKIDKLEPEDDTLHKKVKEIVHKAFWDILTNELSQDPPVYTQALRLLKEIKESLDELLLPHNARTKETVNQVLDIELIRQQAENGVLNFSHYSEYVISLMAKICAPVRDEKIEELRKCTDVIETFKGIMEVIQLMKLDLANFTISMIRPNIIASSIEYEKNKFAEFLKIQTDGLQYTRRWLLKHLSSETENIASLDINSIKQVTHTLLAEAYLDLLEFDFCPNAETLMLDQGRLLDLRNKTCRLAITGSILLLLKPLPYQLNEECKTEIKKHTSVLLESVTSNKDLVTVMPNICIQIKSDIDKIKQDSTNTANNSEDNFLPILESQILELSNPEHKIRQLVTSRIRQFLKNIILSQSAAPQQIPPGLSALQRELTDIAAQFAILIAHNRIVFGEYYQDIITTAISERKSVTI